MTHITCRLTAKNRDQLRNPTLGNRVWATFTFFIDRVSVTISFFNKNSSYVAGCRIGWAAVALCFRPVRLSVRVYVRAGGVLLRVGPANRERKCADTIGTVLVLWAGHFQCKNINRPIFFQVKYTEAILSNSTRKLLWFEITKMLIALKNKFIVLFIIIFGALSFPIAVDFSSSK